MRFLNPSTREHLADSDESADQLGIIVEGLAELLGDSLATTGEVFKRLQKQIEFDDDCELFEDLHQAPSSKM